MKKLSMTALMLSMLAFGNSVYASEDTPKQEQKEEMSKLLEVTDASFKGFQQNLITKKSLALASSQREFVSVVAREESAVFGTNTLENINSLQMVESPYTTFIASSEPNAVLNGKNIYVIGGPGDYVLYTESAFHELIKYSEDNNKPKPKMEIKK